MIEIERLVFVCPSLENAFLDLNWNKFCISPIRQTRPFIRSRYILFKNIKIELLQIIEHRDAADFVYFEEWKQAKRPTWVSTGCKVENLDAAIVQCNKFGIYSSEEFIHSESGYKKGFKYRSCLLSTLWFGKHVYLTEYDNCFLDQRESAICADPLKKERYRVEIPVFSLENITNLGSLNIDEHGQLKLNVYDELSNKKIFPQNFDWIVLN